MRKLLFGLLVLVAVAFLALIEWDTHRLLTSRPTQTSSSEGQRTAAGSKTAGESVQENIDAKFIALYSWAADLNQKAVVWNENCKKDINAAECQTTRLILNEQLKFFITSANRYRSEGTDCRAKMRQRIIDNEARLFMWNLNCAGHTDLAAEVETQCGIENASIMADTEQIKKEGAACTDVKL